MNKGQGHGRLHGCTAVAALKGICYLTKYDLSGLYQNLKFCLKNSGKHWSRSTVTCRSRSYNCVMQLMQLYRCISVPNMMIVADIVCEIQTQTSS